MNLKYYLRGLGIGILVTALVLIAAPREKEVLSDTEIRERAIQLGMVDGNSLTLAAMKENTATETKESETTRESTDATKESEATQGGTEVTKEGEATQESSEATKESETVQESTGVTKESEVVQESTEATESSSTDEHAKIVIKSGANSYSVAKDLETAGVIADAKSFDRYLCDNGYSRRISTGTYEIAFGTTEEEIAKIITGKR